MINENPTADKFIFHQKRPSVIHHVTVSECGERNSDANRLAKTHRRKNEEKYDAFIAFLWN